MRKQLEDAQATAGAAVRAREGLEADVRGVCNHLGVQEHPEVSSRLLLIPETVKRTVKRFIHESFSLVKAHFPIFTPEEINVGWPEDLEDEECAAIEAEVAGGVDEFYEMARSEFHMPEEPFVPTVSEPSPPQDDPSSSQRAS